MYTAGSSVVFWGGSGGIGGCGRCQPSAGVLTRLYLAVLNVGATLRVGAGIPLRWVQLGVRFRRRLRGLLGAGRAGVGPCPIAVASGDLGVDLTEDVSFGAQSVVESGDAVAYPADGLGVEGAVVARGRGPAKLCGAFEDRPVPVPGVAACSAGAQPVESSTGPLEPPGFEGPDVRPRRHVRRQP